MQLPIVLMRDSWTAHCSMFVSNSFIYIRCISCTEYCIAVQGAALHGSQVTTVHFPHLLCFQLFMSHCTFSGLLKDHILPLSNDELREKAVVKLTFEEIFSNVLGVTVCAEGQSTGAYSLTVKIDIASQVSTDLRIWPSLTVSTAIQRGPEWHSLSPLVAILTLRH